ALASDAELLLLDEPTSGLDPLMDGVFQDCIREGKDRGRTVLLSSHILAEVDALCDRLSIIRLGRTEQSGTLQEMRHLTRTSITAELKAPAAGFDSLPGIHGLEIHDSQVHVDVDSEHLDEVVRRLSELGVTSLVSHPPTLEELFLRHYGGELGMVVVALMSVFMIGRLTRGDEEAGRLELVRSLPVGNHAPTFAALIVVVAMNVAVGVLSSASLLAEGLPTAGSLVLGASFAAMGLFFTAAALVVAQITENTRVVYGSSGALLGLAYVMRIIGDIGDGRVSGFSPIGLAQKTRPFAGERWWPLLPLLAAAVALIAVAFRLAVRRDHGAGLVAPRPGRSVAAPSLGHPLGLAMRLQRGALMGWGAGVLG